MWPSRTNGCLTLVYFAAFFGAGIEVGLIGPALLNLAHRTGMRVGAMGALLSAYSVGQMLAAVVSGYLVDRSGGNAQLAVSFVVSAVGCAILPYARSFVLMLACFACFGCTMGVLDTAGNVLLIYMYDKDVGPWMQAAHCLFGVGTLTAPLLMQASGLYDHDSQTVPTWGWLMFADAALFLLVAAVVVWFPSPRKPGAELNKQKGEGKAVETGEIDEAAGEAHANAAAEPAAEGGEGGDSAPRMWLPILLSAVFLSFQVGGLENGFGGFQYTYLVEHQGASSSVAMHINSAFWAAYTASRGLASLYSIYLSPVQIMIGCSSACVLCSTALMVWPDTTSAFWIVSVAFGFAQAPMYATAVSLCQSFTLVDGRAMFIMVVGASLGKFIIPLVVTSTFDFVGHFSFPVTVFIASAACALLFVAIQLAGGRQRARRQLQARSGRESGGRDSSEEEAAAPPRKSTGPVPAADVEVAIDSLQ
jgi:FHS family Na+ dependent glucose MFS transporter 1